MMVLNLNNNLLKEFGELVETSEVRHLGGEGSGIRSGFYPCSPLPSCLAFERD